MSFLAELKRRNVIRVGAAYLVSAWLLIEIADILFPAFGFPRFALQLLIVALALGLVPILILAWAYELTAAGLVRDRGPGTSSPENTNTARRLDQVTIAMILLALAVVATERFVLPKSATPAVANQELGKLAARPQEPAPVAAVQIPAVPTGNSIAVLPFVNMSSDPEQVYFSDGISEELLNGLVKLPGLKVAGRTSSFAFRDKQDDLRTIGKALNVAHILEGSVRKQGMRVRVTAQLVKADDGFHVWSETYDRDAGDIFALQDEITAAIIEALKVQLGTEAAPTAKVADLEAYNVYLQARQKLALRGQENLAAARSLFEKAIAMDPDYAPAHSGLGRTISLLWLYSLHSDTPVSLQEANAQGKQAAEAALALDPENAEAWSVLGMLHMWLGLDYVEAEKAISRSVQLRPNDAEIVNFAGDLYYTTFDPRREATERRAVELDPMHGVNHHDLSMVLQTEGKFEEALEAARAADALGYYDSAPNMHMFATLPALIGLGRYEEANAVVDRMEASPLVKHAVALSMRVRIASAEGDKATEQRLLAELLPLAEAGQLLPSAMAWNLIHAGRLDEAVGWVKRALPAQDSFIYDPGMYPLPERLPDHAALRALFEHPDLSPLYEMRRRNIAAARGAEK